MKRLTVTSDSGESVSAEPMGVGLQLCDSDFRTILLPWDLVGLLGTIMQEYGNQRVDQEIRLMGEE